MTASTQTPELVEIVSPSAIVNVGMSTGFFQRVQDIAGFLLLGKSTAEITAAHALIEQQATRPQSWERHYETVLILCAEYETSARRHNQTEMLTPERLQALLG